MEYENNDTKFNPTYIKDLEDLIHVYLSELGSFPKLTADDEKRLGQKIELARYLKDFEINFITKSIPHPTSMALLVALTKRLEKLGRIFESDKLIELSIVSQLIDLKTNGIGVNESMATSHFQQIKMTAKKAQESLVNSNLRLVINLVFFQEHGRRPNAKELAKIMGRSEKSIN
jgi:DNA-directed RNA polymerase sigma subunit (sigma70/sigma32)